ncbi:hypothetical protein [Sphingopyxis sp. L1A2A]|uniref:hypothetical protein n=1 Tax=Sphingopyxis sp. L1A2A TaxID=2502247 RepID=UPI0010F6D0EE|nr:hypothetical protein [Sphingopyxis sp. L1A2A]
MAISDKVVMAILAPFAAIVAKLAGASNGFDAVDRQNGLIIVASRRLGGDRKQLRAIAAPANRRA